MTPCIGCDLIEVDRMRRVAIENPRVLERIFTPRELAYCRGRRRYESLAGRFCIKEAVMKLLGHGFGRISYLDIETCNDDQGAPFVSLHSSAADHAKERGIDDIAISISHSAAMAMAVAVAVRGKA